MNPSPDDGSLQPLAVEMMDVPPWMGDFRRGCRSQAETQRGMSILVGFSYELCWEFE